ncbi:MAG TPA: exonuclease domain-containing protein, partial [Ktedonobacteraceae bacterium]|nr:exonuclease domain-containing protein [Ktedonobacteraceae bacterium]
MAKKPPVRVALDLETTGLHAEQDAILEVAAIKFQGSTVLDRMETLVAPGRSIPYRVQRLTGITPQKLNGAPQFEAIAKKLQLFLGDLPIVGHSIPFDVGFLRRRGLVRTNPLIDTFELATVLLPSLSSYNLGQVAHSLGIEVAPGRHRAMVDTVLAMDVFLALYEMIDAIDISLLKDLASLDAPRSWPLLSFFKQELRERQERDGLRGMPMRGSLGERFAAQLGMDPRVLSFAIAKDEPPAAPAPPPLDRPVPYVLDRIDQTLTLGETSSNESESLTLQTYEVARTKVKQALSQQTPLLMDVTVGGNDYTPAILPALEWLNQAATEEASVSQESHRLVISCANQQSVRRLMEQGLPALQGSLKTTFPVAHLAERDGYLCVHRWFGAALRRTSGELTAEQARGLAKLGLWAQQTRTGERHEITMLPHEMSAWERISSGYERIPLEKSRSGCAYDRCAYQRKGYCFVQRAEERIQKACIIVTTHAGLLDDLTNANTLLKATDRHLVLDADLLEDEIARWSGQELDQARLMNMLNTIGVELPDGRYQGLLALAAPSARDKGPGGVSGTPTIGKAELDARMLGWFQTLRMAHTAVDHFFHQLGHLLEESHHQGSNGGRDKGRNEQGGRSNRPNERVDQALRLTNTIHNLENWGDVERAWQQVEQRLQAVIDLLHEVETVILKPRKGRNHLDVGSGEDDSLASEFTALAQKLQDQKRLGQQALKLNENEMTYWLRVPPQVGGFSQNRQADSGASAADNVPMLYAQMAQSSAFLKRTLLHGTRGPVFAGVALSIDGSFSFIRNRFG